MPETELEYDKEGRVSGAHFRKHDMSHQIIEECMLAANEAVAEHLAGFDVSFLRRVHPTPIRTRCPRSQTSPAVSATRCRPTSTASPSRRSSKNRPTARSYAVHYSLLRSLKQAIYSPEDEGHYALASDNYCHFTSPIRRYPDLTVHRQLGQWLRTGKAGGDAAELTRWAITAARWSAAKAAERELVKLKLLAYLNERLGTELEVIITGVADYGFFGQAETLPVEGLVHISTLADDYYYYEEATHSLIGRRTGRRYPARRQGAGRGGAHRFAAAADSISAWRISRGGGEGKAAGEATAGVMRGKPVPSASEVRP